MARGSVRPTPNYYSRHHCVYDLTGNDNLEEVRTKMLMRLKEPYRLAGNLINVPKCGALRKRKSRHNFRKLGIDRAAESESVATFLANLNRKTALVEMEKFGINPKPETVQDLRTLNAMRGSLQCITYNLSPFRVMISCPSVCWLFLSTLLGSCTKLVAVCFFVGHRHVLQDVAEPREDGNHYSRWRKERNGTTKENSNRLDRGSSFVDQFEEKFSRYTVRRCVDQTEISRDGERGHRRKKRRRRVPNPGYYRFTLCNKGRNSSRSDHHAVLKSLFWFMIPTVNVTRFRIFNLKQYHQIVCALF